MELNQKIWKSCSSCKQPIAVGGKYYLCSVSTCNGQRTGYQFCSMNCFEAHLPGAKHRDAGAIEKVAPRIIQAPQSPTKTASAQAPPNEVLIIASRLKDYIAAKSDYNTSASVMDCLSDFVRRASERAIENARAEGRRTVMDRDFEFLFKSL
jgi:hypothetical protein